MGEAYYYLKAYPCDPTQFKEAKAFIAEGVRAYEYWQSHRDMERVGNRKGFWEVFEMRFPRVTEYLKGIGLFGGDCNNELAGKLDFGNEGDVEERLSLTDGALWYSAEVWHFASWEYLAQFLKTKYGFENVKWISEEDIDPFDLL